MLFDYEFVLLLSLLQLTVFFFRLFFFFLIFQMNFSHPQPSKGGNLFQGFFLFSLLSLKARAKVSMFFILPNYFMKCFEYFLNFIAKH